MKFGIGVLYQIFISSGNFIKIGCDSRLLLKCIIEFLPILSVFHVRCKRKVLKSSTYNIAENFFEFPKIRALNSALFILIEMKIRLLKTYGN